jgi:hypothetical protein
MYVYVYVYVCTYMTNIPDTSPENNLALRAC